MLGLELALSVGDIAAPLTGDGPRREVLRRMHLDFPLPGADAARMEAGAEQNWRWAMEALEALKTRAAAGEAVRIWADHSPDGACGLLHAASVLAELDAKVILVPLPRWWERYDGAVVQWSSWGEVHHTVSGHLLGGADELTRPVLSMLSRRWTALRRENAPLRAVLSGRVVGVDEDFYDPLLLRLLTAEPQGVGSVVGRFMALELGVGDWLLLRRLRALEEAGAVRITEEDGGRRGLYGAKIRLAWTGTPGRLRVPGSLSTDRRSSSSPPPPAGCPGRQRALQWCRTGSPAGGGRPRSGGRRPPTRERCRA